MPPPFGTCTPKSKGVLDDGDDEVDLASYAWQIWKQATQDNADLARTVEALPPVVYSAKGFALDESRFPLAGRGRCQRRRAGLREIPEGNDHLAWVGANGKTVTESQFTVLRAAECEPATPAVQRLPQHHDLVATGLQLAASQDKAVGGGLGRPSSPRRRTYERLKACATGANANLVPGDEELERALDDMYHSAPLLETAADLLNRLMRSGVNDAELTEAAEAAARRRAADLCRRRRRIGGASRGVLHGIDQGRINMPVFNQEHIKHYRFKQLFNELGWDAPAQQQPYSVLVGDDTWLLDVVAHKSSVQVLHCRPGAQGQLPDYATRQKIERKITTDRARTPDRVHQ